MGQGKLLLNADNPFRPTDPSQNVLNPGDAQPGLIDQILREFDTMHSEMDGLKGELHETRDELHETRETVRNQAAREQALEDELFEAKKRLERSETLHEESKRHIEVHDEKLSLFSKITRSDGHSVLTDVFISIGVVFICGILVLVFQKSRRSST